MQSANRLDLRPMQNFQNSSASAPLKNEFVAQQFEAKLDSYLRLFKSHGLKDLSNAKLMDRVDTKFLLLKSFLFELLGRVFPYYSCLDINGDKLFRYRNQYYDTPDLTFYQHHHNGKTNRFKVRQRHYVETDSKYLEVKYKNNKKRTLKSRVQLSEHTLDSRNHLIKEKLGRNFSDLCLTQLSGYRRIALANEQRAERLTLDLDLWYRLPDSKQIIRLPDLFIAELKQKKVDKTSPFYQLMSRHHFSPLRFSKYCIGCALLMGNNVKTNRFKPVLNKLSKLH